MGLQLPPQAYTKDTLAQAFEWIQMQPRSIQEMATNSDTLVALFLQAKKKGSIIPPSLSAESFKKDLKNLAQNLKDFEVENTPAEARPLPPTASTSAPMNKAYSDATEKYQEKYFDKSLPMAFLDEKSIATIKYTQQRLNLSQESEALRLLIALGAEKLEGFKK